MARNAKRFDCDKCQHKHCDADAALPGSRGAASRPLYGIPAVDGGNVYETNICLLPMITPQTRWLLEQHRHYRNGYLLSAGGIENQQVYYLTAMGIIEAHLAKSLE